MRILLITAFYPPYVVGGWEQLVADINTRLQQRGHETLVLASRYGVGDDPAPEAGVERSLELEADMLRYRPADFWLKSGKRLRHNLEAVRQAMRRFEPDVVFVHVMFNLSSAIPWQAEQLLPGRVVYYVASDWPYAPDPHSAYWTDGARTGGRRLGKRLLAPLALRAIRRQSQEFALKFERVLTVSRAVRDSLAQHAGIPVENMQVVYNGVEVDRFTRREEPASGEKSLELLYAGQFARHKGVHTALEAMELLANRPGLESVRLALVGSGHPGYEAALRQRVEASGLQSRVRFLPRVEREAMPGLFSQFDVLVFPSTWQEPLSRVVQEAMASGLAVVATPTGGTPEIVLDGETGLIFEAEDAAGLANCIERLYHNPALRRRLASKARRLVEEQFNFERMVDEIEETLQATAEERERAGSEHGMFFVA